MRIIDNQQAVTGVDTETWATFPWPSWVPAAIRVHVEDLWPDPRAWAENRWRVRAPILGALIHLSVDGYMLRGRYVHLRDLTGRMVDTTGLSYHTTLVAGTPIWARTQ
jgi:hypothetical protein